LPFNSKEVHFVYVLSTYIFPFTMLLSGLQSVLRVKLIRAFHVYSRIETIRCPFGSVAVNYIKTIRVTAALLLMCILYLLPMLCAFGHFWIDSSSSMGDGALKLQD